MARNLGENFLIWQFGCGLTSICMPAQVLIVYKYLLHFMV